MVVRIGFWSWFDRNPGCIKPEPVEIVQSAAFGVKDMDDDIAVVDKHPSASGESFDAQGALALFAQSIDNAMGDGVDMSFGARGHQHKVVCVVDFPYDINDFADQIGRASCRERV